MTTTITKFDIDAFVSRLSTDRTPPPGAIGFEVWGKGRDGAPNPDLTNLAANIDPQHGGGCWHVTGGDRVDLPTAPLGWLGSAAATVHVHREYAAVLERLPGAPLWCPRWDPDALAAALIASGAAFAQLAPLQSRSGGYERLAQLDALDSSADARGIYASLASKVPPHRVMSIIATEDGLATAEVVSDTTWGAVSALLRGGDMRAAAVAALDLLTDGELSEASASHAAVVQWRAERAACAGYVGANIVEHNGAACVTGAPLGAWPYALADHDWAVLTFDARQGIAHSLAGSRRISLEQRAAVIARANERLTSAERAAGGSAHWAGAAGITGSRDAGSVLSPADVAAIVSECAAHTGPF